MISVLARGGTVRAVALCKGVVIGFDVDIDIGPILGLDGKYKFG